MYGEAEIEHLANLHRAVLGGRSIGQVAPLTREAVAELVARDRARESRPHAATDAPDEEAAFAAVLAECKEAVQRLDAAGLESALKRAALRWSVPSLLDRLVAPFLREIGESWEAGQLQPVHEHMASVELHRLLTWLMQSARVAGDAPLLVVTTPAGQVMELGALMVGATAASEGWRVAWLGPNLPTADIVHSVALLAPSAVAISLVHQTRDAELHKELEHLARSLSGRVPLLVGGRAAPGHALVIQRHGGVVLADLEGLRQWLRERLGNPASNGARASATRNPSRDTT